MVCEAVFAPRDSDKPLETAGDTNFLMRLEFRNTDYYVGLQSSPRDDVLMRAVAMAGFGAARIILGHPEVNWAVVGSVEFGQLAIFAHRHVDRRERWIALGDREIA